MFQEDRNREMERIGDTLGRMQYQARSPSDIESEKYYSETKVEDCTCRECGVSFQGEVTYYKLRPGKPYPPPYCPACQEKKQAEAEAEKKEELERERKLTKEKWRQSCGLPEDLQEKTFENFGRGRNLTAFDAALAWAEGFDLDNPKRYRSLLLYSDIPGVGKTHLAAAIINHIIEHWQGENIRSRCPIHFVKGPRLVRRIRATYNIREGDYTHEREDEVYDQIAGFPLLVLDDVGKESPSKFTRETYWYIIDERVTNGLPVIITSRLPLDGENSLEEVMGEDTADRIYGMIKGEVFKLHGPSYRREAEQA